MGTEYRRGIPSVAHIEAATRLGLVWHRQGHSEDIVTVFKVAPDGVRSNYGTRTILEENSFLPLHRQERSMYYRPIRTDGTLVDWNVLDAEAQYANMPVAQPQPEPCCFVDVRLDWYGVISIDEQGNPVSWERIAQPTPTAAPAQPQGFRADLWQRMLRSFFGDRLSEVDTTGLRLARITAREHDRMFYFDNGDALLLSGMSDAGYTDADILARWAVYQELKPLYDLVAGAQGEAPMPEDAILELARRSGWETYPREALLRRTDELQIRETASGWTWSSDDDSTCGNQLCNFAAVLDTVAEQRVAARVEQAPTATATVAPGVSVQAGTLIGARPATTQARITEAFTDAMRNTESFRQTLDTMNNAITQAVLGKVEAPEKPGPLPRFTADELDDVDHSQSTKLDSAPLKRGKLPTPEQIGKYREVLAKRSGTTAEALKASGIDCEVAQYVLERWASGLSDETALWLLRDVGKYSRPGQSFTQARIDELAEQAIKRPTLDIAEPADDSAQRRREEREAQRQRMAALQAQLAAERAARTVEPQPEPTRFDLLECDPKADPAVSIAAWEARQKRSTVRPMPMPEPQPWSHCLPFEIVDAEAEGLRPGAAFTAFLGRALNPNC